MSLRRAETVPSAQGIGDAPVARPASPIVSNAIALMLARPLTWASTVGLTILLPRYLGDVNLGRMNVAFAFADWCGLIASFGIATYLTKEVARQPGEASSIVLNSLLVRVSLAIAVGGAATFAVMLLDLNSLTRQLILLLTAHMLLMVVGGVLFGALQGVQEIRLVALIDAASKVLQLGLIALVLLQGHGPIAVAMGYVVADVFMIVGGIWAVRRHVGLGSKPDVRSWPIILKRSFPFLLWETALLTYARVDVIILAIFTNNAVLGWYSLAYRLISIPLFLPVILMTVVFPALSSAALDEPTFNRLLRRTIQLGALLTIPMAAGLMVLSEGVVELFGYPTEFRHAILPITLLAASLPLVGFNMIVGAALAACDRQRLWAFAGVAAAVVNPALNFAAIPFTQSHFENGAIGAAAVTSTTEALLLAAGLMMLPKRSIDAATFVNLTKCLVAGAVMTVAIWPLRDQTVVLTIPIGAAVYAAAAFWLRIVSVADLRGLRAQMSRQPVGAA